MNEYKKALKQNIKLNKDHFTVGLFIIALAAIVGIVVMLLILFNSSEEETYGTLGAFLILVFGGMMVLIYDVFYVPRQFHQAISMNRARKPLLVSLYVMSCLDMVILLASAKVVSVLELALYRKLFPPSISELDATYWMGNPLFLADSVLGIPVVCLFASSLMMRFPKGAFWTLWALWMFGCLGVPRMVTDTLEQNDTLLGTVGTAVSKGFGAIPSALMRPGICVLLILAALATFKMFTTQGLTDS
jgi:hypothetical protein